MNVDSRFLTDHLRSLIFSYFNADINELYRQYPHEQFLSNVIDVSINVLPRFELEISVYVRFYTHRRHLSENDAPVLKASYVLNKRQILSLNQNIQSQMFNDIAHKLTTSIIQEMKKNINRFFLPTENSRSVIIRMAEDMNRQYEALLAASDFMRKTFYPTPEDTKDSPNFNFHNQEFKLNDCTIKLHLNKTEMTQVSSLFENCLDKYNSNRKYGILTLTKNNSRKICMCLTTGETKAAKNAKADSDYINLCLDWIIQNNVQYNKDSSLMGSMIGKRIANEK